jgi:hypothetical protein
MPFLPPVAVRSRFRFSTKALLVGVGILCALMSTLFRPMYERMAEERLISRARSLGKKVQSSFSEAAPREWSVGSFLMAGLDSSFFYYRMYDIDLSGSQITDDDLQWLATIKHIRKLNLSRTALTDQGLRELQKLPFLMELDLSGTKASDESVRGLAGAQWLSSLKTVGSNVTYAALRELDEKLPYAHFCEQNATVELSAAGIQVPALSRIVSGEGAPYHVIRMADQVQDIYISGKRYDQPFVLTPREVLHLSHLNCTPSMLLHTAVVRQGALAELARLGALTSIGVYASTLSDADLQGIVRQTQLESLTLGYCQGITDEGIETLKELVNLKTLAINGCNGVSKQAVDRLAEQLPRCQCKWSQY